MARGGASRCSRGGCRPSATQEALDRQPTDVKTTIRFAPLDATHDVFTDGACSGNPGPGGWAWAVPGGSWASGAEPRTTNQRMELQAVLEAVRCARRARSTS